MTGTGKMRQKGPIMFPIKASAGAGKTHELTMQYLEHLASSTSGFDTRLERQAPCAKDWETRPSCFADIVAITFTNAAVEELRQRVLGSLKKIALGFEKMKGLGKEQAAHCLDALLKDMGQMNVRTIDSLLFQIVRSAAPGLQLSPDFQPVFSFEEAVEEELENFLLEAENGSEEHRALLKEVMQCFLERSESASSHKDYKHGERRDGSDGAGDEGQAVRKTSTEESKKPLFFDKPLLERLKDYLRIAFLNERENFPAAADIRKKFQELPERIKTHARAILDLEDEINTQTGGNIKINGNAKPQFQLLAEGNFKNIESPYFAKSSITEVLNKIKQPVSDLDRMEEEYTALKRVKNKWSLYRHYLKNAPFVELAARLVDSYFERLQEQKLVPGGLMPLLAIDALNFEYGICDTLCRLGTRLSHFLIDEFQDTSLTQWEALKPLLLEALSRAGSFIWVGDIKQSIFMWAGASPELFDDIPKDPDFAAMVPSVVPKTLEYNRRSAAEIVEHNNRMFEKLGDPAYARKILEAVLPNTYFDAANRENYEAAAARIANVFKDARQKLPEGADPGGYVNLVELDGDKEGFLDNFADALMTFLKERVGAGLAFKDVMVLVRYNQEAAYLAEKLAANSMNVVSENSLLLANQPLVVQSCAFLEFMDNPANDIALMTVLTGSLFATHPAASEISVQDLQDFAAAERPGPLYKELARRWPAIWKSVFEPFFKKAKLLAPYDAVREWHRRMGAEERFPDEKVFLRSLLEELYAAEKMGISSIPAFLDYWHDSGQTLMAQMPDGIDAVRIMTVHKAKGLAAPVVFVPFTQGAMALNAKKVNGLEIVEHGSAKLVVDIQKERTPQAFYKEYERLIVEGLDLLYVAFTRPRRELHIYTNTANPEKNLIKVLGKNAGISWPCGSLPEFVKKGEAATEVFEAQPCSTPPLVEDAVALPWVSWLKVAPSKLFSGSRAAIRGTFLHYCLENMRFTGNLAADIENAWQFGLAHAAMPGEEGKLESLKAGMEWLLGFEQVRGWLETGWPEQPLLNVDGRTLRTDLLVKLPHCLLILDYKTGLSADEEGAGQEIRQKHVEQIRSYMDCVKGSNSSSLPIYGLLVYLDKGEFLLVEEDGRENIFTDCPLDQDGNRL